MNRIFAIGDIHGCYDQLRELIESKIKATPGDKLLFLGDYIDRGKNVKEVIDYVISLKNKNFNIVTLIGNHESMLVDALETGDTTLWSWNGGYETLRSFGTDIVNDLDKKYIKFFNDLDWYHEVGENLFVHAGFNDTLADPFTDRMSMIWVRRETYRNPLLVDRTIIHGHTPITFEECKRNILNGNRVINIDTGCVYTEPGMGKLTAIELNTKELISV
jgi:serine/threonine protein phosphatase 1